ncbi:MAG: hypothetical protein H0U12_00305 [Thermoleophilaceae bacterium]|nr:hypothetical protein [Thermoleophilaceae bacterium]
MTARAGQSLPRVLASLLAVLAPLALASCGSGGSSIDDPNLPYSFDYPDGFQTGGKSTVPAREGGFENQTIVAKESGQDFVAVQTQRLRRQVDARLVPRVKREVEQAARRIGKVRGRSNVRIGGLDGVSLQMGLQATGVPVGARWIYAAKDRTLYWINCQWQSDRQDVLGACDRVMRTFRAR